MCMCIYLRGKRAWRQKCSGELRHGTCHFYTIYTGISKISSVYGNLKDQMKLDLCICEALTYTSVPWKLQLWAWLSITTNIN